MDQIQVMLGDSVLEIIACDGMNVRLGEVGGNQVEENCDLRRIKRNFVILRVVRGGAG